MIIVGHGPSLASKNLGREIDSHDFVVRLKYGHELTRINPASYGTRTDAICSTLKTWRPYYKIRPKIKEWWGYRNWPGQEKELEKIKLYYTDITVRTEFEAVDKWLATYRSLADVKVDYKDKWSSYAKEGDEPWCSTGMGAIIIGCASYKPAELVLAGFDNLVSGKKDGFQSIFREKGWIYPPHGWQAENKMLPLIAAAYGVNIRSLA